MTKSNFDNHLYTLFPIKTNNEIEKKTTYCFSMPEKGYVFYIGSYNLGRVTKIITKKYKFMVFENK